MARVSKQKVHTVSINVGGEAGLHGTHYVRAISNAAAQKHVAAKYQPTMVSHVATEDELLEIGRTGATVETAGEEPDPAGAMIKAMTPDLELS